MSAPLLIKHLFDTTAYGINHIEVNHSPTQTFIAKMRLRFFIPQSILQGTRDERASIRIIQISWILHEIDALLESVVLMANTIMKGLTDGIVVILLHRVGEKFKATDGTDSNKGLTNGDYSNGILSLSPVFSFHLYIKIGLWILTELTEFSTRRLSWMKRERRIIKSWIHSSIPILSSRLIGAWSIETLQNHKTIGLSKLDTPIALLIRTDITFIDQPLSIRVLLLQ